MTTTIRDYMSSEVSPVQGDTSLVKAAQQMRVSGVGGIPVVDPGDGGRCVGILTERDVVVRALAEERDPRAAVVCDVATLRPVMCAPDDVSTALVQMREAEIQHLPVVEGGRVIGVISLADIVFRRPDQERGTIVLPPLRSR